jgi:hypothetical protein
MKKISTITLLLVTLFIIGNITAQEGPKADKPTKMGLFKRLRHHNKMSITDKGTSKGTVKAPAVSTPAK